MPLCPFDLLSHLLLSGLSVTQNHRKVALHTGPYTGPHSAFPLDLRKLESLAYPSLRYNDTRSFHAFCADCMVSSETKSALDTASCTLAGELHLENRVVNGLAVDLIR